MRVKIALSDEFNEAAVSSRLVKRPNGAAKESDFFYRNLSEPATIADIEEQEGRESDEDSASEQ